MSFDLPGIRTVQDLFLHKQGIISILDLIHFIVGRKVIRRLDRIACRGNAFFRLSNALAESPEKSAKAYWLAIEDACKG